MKFVTVSSRRKAELKSGLRAINQGTRYDVSGRLRAMAREIERGELGDVRDATIVLRKFSRTETNGKYGVTFETYHVGPGDIATALLMLESGKKAMIGE